MRQEETLMRPSAKWPVSVRQSKRYPFALIMLVALCLTSCRTSRILVSPERTDSIRSTSSVEIESRSVIEPARLDTAAELQITQAQIDSLPAGAEYSVQTSQARASLRKQASGGMTLSAQGISPAKVTTATKAKSEADAKGAENYKPPEVHLKADKETTKWYQDGFFIGALLFAILSITAVVWAGRKN